jgi:anti-sigma B factor antagonist
MDNENDQDVLQLTFSTEDDITTVEAVGDIDLSTTPELRTKVEQMIAALPSDGKLRYMLLDMREVPFIDSAGLALLVEIRKRFHNTCRLAVLIAAATQPERVLRLGRFDTFLTIGYSIEDLKKAGIGGEISSAT